MKRKKTLLMPLTLSLFTLGVYAQQKPFNSKKANQTKELSSLLGVKKVTSKKNTIINPFLVCDPELIEDLQVRTITKRAKRLKAPKGIFTIREEEGSFDTANNNPKEGEPILNFGNSNKLKRNALIKGVSTATLSDVEDFPKVKLNILETIDNGAAPLASVISIPNSISNNEVQRIEISSIIGDGPNGTSSGTGTGDRDFYSLELKENDLLSIKVKAKDLSSALAPVATLHRAFNIETGFGLDLPFLGDLSEASETSVPVTIDNSTIATNFETNDLEQLAGFNFSLKATEDGVPTSVLAFSGDVYEFQFYVKNSGTYVLDIRDTNQLDRDLPLINDIITGEADVTEFSDASVSSPLVSGDEFGAGGEGEYLLNIDIIKSSRQIDRDVYSVRLNKGDVFGASVVNSEVFEIGDTLDENGLQIVSPDNELNDDTDELRLEMINTEGVVDFSTISGTFFGSLNSPLPFEGDAVLNYIAPETGLYHFAVLGSVGRYEVNIGASSTGPVINPGLKQYIYLDFTGEENLTRRDFALASTIPDLEESNPGFLDREINLSPFEDFLENWGIENTPENLITVTKKITANVQRNLKAELLEKNINPNLDVVIISDYGNQNLGKRIPNILKNANVPFSRIIVGGTAIELGIRTIGISNSIDVGNFGFEDLAVVVLDLLSGSSDSDNIRVIRNTLNNITLAGGATIEDLVSEYIGNVTSHEAGHFLGCFHTDNTNDILNIMDQGGSRDLRAGITLRNGIFGDENTVDPTFVTDAYVNSFTLSGANNYSDVNTAFGLSFNPKRIRNRARGAKSLILENEETTDFTLDRIKKLEASVLSSLDTSISSLKTFVYPNPVNKNNVSTISFNTTEKGTYIVDLYTASGLKISTLLEKEIVSKGRELLDFVPENHKLNSGLYFIKIKTPSKETTTKVFVN